MAKGLLITFEGSEGCGKSTQVELLERRLRALSYRVRTLREPGGTPIGEEIRYTLKHSKNNAAMTFETELLLMNASRAQLVRETIRPALAAGEIVVCDRFYDSTLAYQGYGRGLDLQFVKDVTDFAIGDTQPNLTLLLSVPIEISESRRLARRQSMLLEVPPQSIRPESHPKLPFSEPLRDRMEEADRSFFERVVKGFEAIAAAEPQRVRLINGVKPVNIVCEEIWEAVRPVLPRVGRW
jgi:dTMP kinase